MPIPRPGTPVRGSTTGRPLMAAMDLFGRRWALRVLWELRAGPLGARALLARCEGLSSSVLYQRLRELASSGIIAPSADGYDGEIEATAWAYAATVALGLEPTVLFHEGGYKGYSSSLVTTYTLGVYPGCHGLAMAGLTATGEQARALGVEPYPHMLRWLRD